MPQYRDVAIAGVYQTKQGDLSDRDAARRVVGSGQGSV
jgi:hypothetical protein